MGRNAVFKMKQPLKSLTGFVGAIVVAALTLTASMAAESAPGTWKWSFTGQNGQAFETTLKLTQDGG